MQPWWEQKNHDFRFAKRPGAVWAPFELDAKKFRYGGVGLGDLAGVGSGFEYKATHNNGYWPHYATTTTTLATKSTKFTARVEDVQGQRVGSKVRLTVRFKLGSGTGWHLVAAPYEESMPAFTDFGAYKAAGDIEEVDGITASVVLEVTPGPIDTWFVFLAKGIASQQIIPFSQAVVTTA